MNRRRVSTLPALDRRVLLTFLGMTLAVFVIMWLASRDFMPGARMFPYFLTAAGVAVTVGALLRVWWGIEPSKGPGQILPDKNQDARLEYRIAIRLMGGIAAYYVGIALVGFTIASALYLVAFARWYGQSYAYAIVTTAVALALVYTLSAVLNVYLPAGWLVELVR